MTMELQDGIYDKVVVSSSNPNIYADKCAKDQIANYDTRIMTYNDSNNRHQCHKMEDLACRQLTQKVNASLTHTHTSTCMDGRLVSITINSVLLFF